MKVVHLRNFRKGLATNSSSTHSVIYRNEGDMFKDMDIFELNYYGRCDSTIAASREAKIKYVLAEIYRDETLVKALSDRYPEMKEYYPLIKEQNELDESDDYISDSKFGMCARGELSISREGSLAFDLDYISNLIDNPELVIIGGSDEADFVWQTTEGHRELPIAESFGRSKKGRMLPVRNGNYWYAYGNEYSEYGPGDKYHSYGKFRFTDGDELPVPEYPELIDIRITNRCQHACPFCFMNSNPDAEDADKDFIKTIVSNLGRHKVEFSVGGGNILLHKDLKEILRCMHDNGHVVNVTINVKDINAILNNKGGLLDTFLTYVDGIGISVFSREDIRKAELFKKEINENLNYGEEKYVVAHMIPELLGLETSVEMTKTRLPILFLGYKTNGRGASQKITEFTDSDLAQLFNEKYWMSVDTAFMEKYGDWLRGHYKSCHYTVNGAEGEYSMYIDAVEKKGYKSSYELDKPYDMDYSKKWVDGEINKDIVDTKEAFRNIRKDCGFAEYKAKHYFD